MSRALLLLALLAFVLAACSPPSPPELAVETASFDFGDVANGELVQRDVALRNTGGSRLELQVAASCGCTAAWLDPPGGVPAHGQGVLHIRYDTAAYGEFDTGPKRRTVTLTTNDPQHAEVNIEFTINVLPRPTATP